MAPPPPKTSSNDASQTADTTNPPLTANPTAVRKWVLDAKTKTCKCSVCSERVRVFSYKCSKCWFRVCSECGTEQGCSYTPFNERGRDYVENGCWCRFRFRENPAFHDHYTNLQPPLRLNGEVYYESLDPQDRAQAAVTGYPVWIHSHNERAGRRAAVGEERRETRGTKELASGSASSRAAATALRRSRRDVDRSRSYAEMDSDHELDDGGCAPRKTARVDVDSEGSIIIIGAGIIGLFLAVELAEKARARGETRTIEVVEINDTPCALASGNCAGFLTTAGMDERWEPLAEVAREAWQEIEAQNPPIGFRARVCEVVHDNDSREAHSVAWCSLRSRETLFLDEKSFGRVDIDRLVEWLLTQCDELGVGFYFGCRAVGVNRDRAGDVNAIRIQSAGGAGMSEKTIACTNVVLAAGPFTTGIFAELFPESSLALENRNQRMQWVDLDGFQLGRGDNIGVLIPHIAGQKPVIYRGPLRMTARRSANTVSVSCGLNAITVLPLARAVAVQTTQPLARNLQDFRALVAKHIDRDGANIRDKDQYPSEGISIVSTADAGNPMLGRVSISGLGNLTVSSGRMSRVSVCYGFGQYGTMLAPGVARIMAQLIDGSEPDVDVYDFAVPEIQAPRRAGLGPPFAPIM